jgi:hypothetical protein
MRTSLIFLSFAFAVTFPAASAREPAVGAPELAGRWIGDSQVIVTWCNQKKIALDLTVHEDGRVSGTLGDAEITSGVVIPRTSRSLPTRWLYNTEYLIRVELSGPLVAAEGIHRDSAALQVSLLANGRLIGGIHSNGLRFYPGTSREELKKKMIFSTSRLNLARVEEIKE